MSFRQRHGKNILPFTDADIAGPKIEVGFNCKFLLDSLKVISDDKVKLMMNGGNLPLKIIPVDGTGYTYIVCVLRIRND